MFLKNQSSKAAIVIGPMTILPGSLLSSSDVEKRVRPAVGPLSHLSDKALDHFLS